MKKLAVLLVVILTLLCSTVFAAAASPDPAVTIVNPANTNVPVCSDGLLVSVKVTQPKTIKVKVYEIMQAVDGNNVSIDVNKIISSGKEPSESLKNGPRRLCAEETFTCTNNLTFFTKQVNELNPGIYVVKASTVDGSGKELYASESLVVLTGKQTVEDDVKDDSQGGALQFIQNLFKNLFK